MKHDKKEPQRVRFWFVGATVAGFATVQNEGGRTQSIGNYRGILGSSSVRHPSDTAQYAVE